MSDFTVRSESIDVEQIMEQIRTRIREKRGVDYTEQQLRELAAVKLEKFLDPRGVRSDLLQRFKERQLYYEKPSLPLYTFEDTTIYETHRGPLQRIRRLLNPILKLLFNPNPIIHALHSQSEINALTIQRDEEQATKRFEMESLYFEIIHNLVFEMTRTSIEVKNLKMRVESLASRLEFSERRARALESVVAYRSSEEFEDGGAETDHGGPPPTADSSASPSGGPPSPEGPGQRSRRRRRRRGRRGGPSASFLMGAPPANNAQSTGGGAPPSSAPGASRWETTERSAPSEPGSGAPSSEPGVEARSNGAAGVAPSGAGEATAARPAQDPDQDRRPPQAAEPPSARTDDFSAAQTAQGHPDTGAGTTDAGSPPAASRDDDRS